MLFRTKFLIAFIALGGVAIGSATLLIYASQRNNANQIYANLAHESLSGYFQLSGAVFRTFKQTRRDLISGSGTFAFDFDHSVQEIKATLDQIENTLQAEARFSKDIMNTEALENLAVLRSEVDQALADIQIASDMIVSGRSEQGRQTAIGVLQGQVDVKIASLIEDAITVQRNELTNAQQEIRALQKSMQTTAWITAIVAILLSVTVFFTLLRRFQTGLKALDAGAQEYAENNLNYVIALPGRDELSAVAHSFTAMAQNIQAKQDGLEAARRDLELRVAERTSELSAANTELRDNDNKRRQFFADIGHELRTPVSAIRGEAEVAMRAKTDRLGAQQAALKTIVSITDELAASVGDLFMIARDMAGILEFRKTPLDLGYAVSLGVEQIQSISDQKKAVIAVHMPKEPIQIMGDTSRIAQLLRILITNGLEHTPHSVHIDVSLRTDGTDAVLSVADDGPGIPEQDWPRIFDRFSKGSGRRGTTTTSTGLGLAIAKSIVTGHGGKISVTRSARGGADLVARFPLSEARQSL